jgi:hypothetical protein
MVGRRIKLKESAVALGILACAVLALSNASSATARTRSCGELKGGHVVVLRGLVSCRTARRVLIYATNHHAGNGPGSPRGWECYRIAGDPQWTGIECGTPPGTEASPRKWIADRNRL